MAWFGWPHSKYSFCLSPGSWCILSGMPMNFSWASSSSPSACGSCTATEHLTMTMREAVLRKKEREGKGREEGEERARGQNRRGYWLGGVEGAGVRAAPPPAHGPGVAPLLPGLRACPFHPWGNTWHTGEFRFALDYSLNRDCSDSYWSLVVTTSPQGL